MEFKTVNREWVKNAAIIFLAVLLVLTFFSNTIMNRSLPEVATQMVSNGTITAKVRGTGTVAANGLHEVKATQTREIRAVMVKSGQEVETGDVLFVLGAGDSAELEAAQEQLRQLQSSYNTTAITSPEYNESAYNAKIKEAEDALGSAKASEEAAKKVYDSHTDVNNEALKQAIARLDAAIIVRDEASKKLDAQVVPTKSLYDNPALELTTIDNTDPNNPVIVIDKTKLSTALQDKLTARDAARDDLKTKTDGLAATPPTSTQEEVNAAKLAYDTAVTAVKVQALSDLSTISTADVDAAQAEVDKRQAEVAALSADDIYYQNYIKARDARVAAETALESANSAKKSAYQASASVGVTLTDLAVQINKQKEKIKELSGDSADQVVANVAGTVVSVGCTAGDTKAKDDVLCTIEVPDMGYTLSFSVTNDQAKRLRIGNTATVSNYYWGQEIKATLTSMKTDPKNPQSNKLLTFDLTGDVTAGSELTLSVGEKSANYDIIIPNSAIRSDTNGSFVLAVRAKNSPLGNRYIAQRVAVELIAADDSNSAVSGELEYGDYVITTSNAPIKTGDQVRMADN